MSNTNYGPLTGVRVLDISTMIAGPYGASLLGDLGAEIIKIELPGKGDTSRNVGPWKGEEPLRWPGLSRNKKSLTLDFHKEEGKEIFKELVKKSDVVLEGFRPGTLEKWGLGYDVLKEINPGLILTRQSAYGQTGPYANRPGFGTPSTAFSGYTYLHGFQDRHPVSPAFSLLDYISGVYMAFGTVSALYYRDNSELKKGQIVEMGLYESMFRMMEFLIAEFDQLGKVRERSPMLSGHSSPSGTYKTKDEAWVVLVCSTQKTWERLAHSMNRADLIDHPQFLTNKERLANDDELQVIVKAFMESFSRKDLLKRMEEYDVPVSPVLSIKDIFENPQYEARNNIVEIDHPRLGKIKIPGVVPNFSETPGSIRHRAPDLGENNEEILGEFLGLSKDKINSLKKNGVI